MKLKELLELLGNQEIMVVACDEKHRQIMAVHYADHLLKHSTNLKSVLEISEFKATKRSNDILIEIPVKYFGGWNN